MAQTTSAEPGDLKVERKRLVLDANIYVEVALVFGSTGSSPGVFTPDHCVHRYLHGIIDDEVSAFRQLEAQPISPANPQSNNCQSTGQPQIDKQRTIQSQQIIISKNANPLSQPISGNGCDLVHHQMAVF